MADVVSSEKRSQMMAGIKGKDTRPEILVRKELHKIGYRYTLHKKDIPGKPDIVFPKYKTIVFVHGCFWHWHDCHLFKLPSTREDFWKTKIAGNKARDERHKKELLATEWKILTIWECALRGKTKKPLLEVVNEAVNFLHSKDRFKEITGN